MSSRIYTGETTEALDLNIESNMGKHNTDGYGLIEDDETPRLIVRRGQSFDITVTFRQEIQEKDLQIICFYDDIMTQFPVSKQKVDKKWGAWITKTEKNKLTISINTPPDCPVGLWKLQIAFSRTAEYCGIIDLQCYILCNAWCEDDQVYMKDEDDRMEYVLNESGRVFTGAFYCEKAKPWDYGHLEEEVLKCSLGVLKSRINNSTEMGNVVTLVRAISAVANSCDGFGILHGNWSGDYEGETAPWEWTGSFDIIEEYMKDKRAVKYGQCWVFSALVVALCRTLGIPTRSVTCFKSAHDTDGSLKIEKYVDDEGNTVEDKSHDSVWNFHVWNEAWIRRNDLPKGYDGWQAFDGTPQERSEGDFQCGPAPVVAIKNGEMTIGKDTRFIFSEVNADYVIINDKTNKVVSLAKEKVGHHISTKRPGNNDKWGCKMIITDLYKHKEGSAEERIVVKKAGMASSNPDFYKQLEAKQDVKFTLHEVGSEEDKDKGVVIGQPVTCRLTIENKSGSKRTIKGVMTLECMTYTNDAAQKKPVKETKFNMILEGNTSQTVELISTYKEYESCLREQCQMKVICSAVVKEIDMVYFDDDQFQLTKPDLEMKTKSTICKLGDEFDVFVNFTNKLDVPLTDCKMSWTGTGLYLKSGKINFGSEPLKAGASFEKKITVKPKTAGPKSITCVFNSKQLTDVDETVNFMVFR